MQDEMLPLERILNQLNEFYQYILDNQDKDLTVSPEILENIHRLSREVEEISRHTENELVNRGVSSEVLNNTIYGPKSQLPVDIKNLLERALYLKSQLEGCRNVLKDAIQKQSEQKKKRRSKKGKGRDGWIPA